MEEAILRYDWGAQLWRWGVKKENLCWLPLNCVTIICCSSLSSCHEKAEQMQWHWLCFSLMDSLLLVTSVNIKQLLRVDKMGLEQQFSDPVGIENAGNSKTNNE